MNIKHFIYKNGFLITTFGLILVLNACSNSTNTGNTVNVQNLNQQQQIETGQVLSVRNVVVNSDSQNSNNNNNVINSIGAVANSSGLNGIFGSVDVLSLGRMIANNSNSTENAQEITVRKNNGQTVAITQVSNEKFSPGEYVKILVNNGKALVTR